jgi:hypothetical protein
LQVLGADQGAFFWQHGVRLDPPKGPEHWVALSHVLFCTEEGIARVSAGSLGSVSWGK